MTADDLLQIVIIEGCLPSLEYWDKPTIVDFDNKMFATTHCLDYYSLRTEDKIKSSDYTFFFDFLGFSFHYTRDYEKDKEQKINGRRISIETLRFLISKGYDVPLY